jgi:hypothetical protein
LEERRLGWVELGSKEMERKRERRRRRTVRVN